MFRDDLFMYVVPYAENLVEIGIWPKKAYNSLFIKSNLVSVIMNSLSVNVERTLEIIVTFSEPVARNIEQQELGTT